MRHASRNPGFILIIVVALLGVLAFMALSIVQISTESRKLSQNQVSQSRTRMMCRSGLESAISRQLAMIPGSDWTFGLQSGADLDQTSVSVKDLNGCLNINDGIEAGKIDPLLSGSYVANQVDPWPGEVPASPWPHGVNPVNDPVVVSGMINLRIRALLNAYGDAHRYVVTPQLGWPGQGGHQPQTSFEFTSTDSGVRGVSTPGRDPMGNTLQTPEDIAASSTGLGDRIIAARPSGGYQRLEQIRDLVEDWWADHKPTGYVGTRSFFDIISADLTTTSFEDNRFFRLEKEHGKYFGDVTQYQVTMPHWNFLETAPPNFQDELTFRPHSVPLINLNSASDLVKAAVFYAPSNVSYIAEGAWIDLLTGPGIPIKSPREWLATAGPAFEPTRIKENGYPLVSNGNPPPKNVQRQRLMSLTDALRLSNRYRAEASPVSFPQFTQWLVNIRKDGSNPMVYERASPRTFESARLPLTTKRGTPSNGMAAEPAWFSPEYIEYTLPNIFSCVRRLPGYMGAPASLLSPYIQEGEHYNHQMMWHNYYGRCLKSVEDVVFREHIPKVCFQGQGYVEIRSRAHLKEGAQSTRSSLVVSMCLMEHKILRTQEDFEANTVTAETDADIVIGPEPRHASVAPPVQASKYFGVVGLRDRAEGYSVVAAPWKLSLPFDGSLAHEPASNFLPRTGSTDPWVTDAVVEEPPVEYPTLDDDWATVQAKLNTLRNTPPAPGKTWRVPPVDRDLRHELFLHDAPWYNMPFTNAPLVDPTDPNGPNEDGLTNLESFFKQMEPHGMYSDQVDGTPHPLTGQSPDQYSWSCTRLAGYESFFCWDLWATSGPWGAANWVNGPPRADDKAIQAAALEGTDRTLFDRDSLGSDLSPFGGVFLSARGHGPRATGKFNDSLYLRPMDLWFPGGPGSTPSPNPYLPGKDFHRGYVSMWVRMPTGYHSTFNRRTLFQLTLWEASKMLPTEFLGHVPTPTENNTVPIAETHPQLKTLYRPVNLTLYLEANPFPHGEGTTPHPAGAPPAGATDALYSVVFKHDKDKGPSVPWTTDPSITAAYSGMRVQPWPQYYSALTGNYLNGYNILGLPLHRYDLSPNNRADTSLPWPDSTVNPSVEYPLFYSFGSYPYNGPLNTNPNSNANVAKELEMGPYANIPGMWRRVVARWDLGIVPTAANARYQLALSTDSHRTGITKMDTAALVPFSREFSTSAGYQFARAYNGFQDGNMGMMWSFGEMPVVYQPAVTIPPELHDTGLGFYEVFNAGGGAITNFNNHEYEYNDMFLLPMISNSQGMPSFYPYPTIQSGGAYPVMRLNSCIDNLVIQLGWPGASDATAIGRQSGLPGHVNGDPNTAGRRYNITASPLREPRWSLDPHLPAGAKLVRVGARIYDLPFLHDTTDLPPWQAPRVDFQVADASGTIPLDTSYATAASSPAHANYVYTSPAWRRPAAPVALGANARIRLLYRAVDTRGNALAGWNFSDIPWIEEVSWSYIPKQVRYLSFQWE